MVASPQEWNYRNHVQFHLSRAGELGYIRANSRDMFPISECHLPEAALNKLWPGLEFDPGLGLERISLRLGMDDEIMLVLESDRPEPPELELEAALSVVHLTGEDALVMAGDEAIPISVKDRTFRVSAASFFQVNTAHGREDGAAPARPFTGFSPNNLVGCLLWSRIVQRILCRAGRTPDRG